MISLTVTHASWSGLRTVALRDGSAETRRQTLSYALEHTDEHGRLTGRRRFDLLVVSYEQVTVELAALTAVPWRYLIVDEAHRLKNPNSKLVGSLRALGAPHTTLLTGTPVQNNVR